MRGEAKSWRSPRSESRVSDSPGLASAAAAAAATSPSRRSSADTTNDTASMAERRYEARRARAAPAPSAYPTRMLACDTRLSIA